MVFAPTSDEFGANMPCDCVVFEMIARTPLAGVAVLTVQFQVSGSESVSAPNAVSATLLPTPSVLPVEAGV